MLEKENCGRAGQEQERNKWSVLAGAGAACGCLTINKSPIATGRGDGSGKSCGQLPRGPHALHGLSCLPGLHADRMAKPPPPGCVVSLSTSKATPQTASLGQKNWIFI
eukprot:scaffold264644_cov23-Tisochrysis_lutea.AAC.1